jgi:hypothetical protein
MRIKITKLKELPNPVLPNNVPVGTEKVFDMPTERYNPPSIGRRFCAGLYWSTSPVQKILPGNKFETMNSLYHYEIIE